jgi:hypothetical protein
MLDQESTIRTEEVGFLFSEDRYDQPYIEKKNLYFKNPGLKMEWFS